jgi:hypothetical protein
MAGSQKLIDQYRAIHATESYGNTSVKNLRFLRPEVELLRPRSVVDYGCGQSKLLEALGLAADVRLVRYDPAIPAFQERPRDVSDLLLNVDVLEHIEEGDIDDVLADMRSLCRNAIIIVDTAPAVRTLDDGRNAHVSLHPHAWWRDRISRHFGALEVVGTARRTRAGFKTWSHDRDQRRQYWRLRAAETARHLGAKLTRRPR